LPRIYYSKSQSKSDEWARNRFNDQASLGAKVASDPAFEVALGSERLDPLEEQKKAEANNEPLPESDTVGAWIVQVQHSLTAEERSHLQQGFGLSLSDFVPKLAYIERLPGRIVDALKLDPLVRAVASYQPRLKVAPTISSQQSANNEPQVFKAVLFSDADTKQVVAKLIELGASNIVISDQRKNAGTSATIRFQLAFPQIEDASAIDEVRWIEPLSKFVDDGNPKTMLQAGTEGTLAPIWAFGLHGEGQVIGILDNGPPDIRHCFFADTTDNTPGPAHRKILAIRNPSGQRAGDHATFVAGCAAGDDMDAPGASPQRGGAWAAKLVLGNRNDLQVFGADVADPMSTMLEQLIASAASGATIHSNSFHAEPQGRHQPATYDLTSFDVDTFAWMNEDQLVFGSSGNTGETQGPPGTAKNTVCVAAALANLKQPSFGDGAAGPTADGRRKPDLMMVGCQVESARLGGSSRVLPCRTIRKGCATSFATPLAAAGGALTRQYFMEGFYPSGTRQPKDTRTPSGALLKAVLLNSTIPTASGTPDNSTGWGLVDLPGTLFFEGGMRRLTILDVRNADGLETGQTSTLVVNVESELDPLNITLVWTEPPGGIGAASSVVNNLDLEVTSPDGVLLLGNVYKDGHSTQGGTADGLNNVEMVSVASPASGDWTIAIKATEVNVGNPGQGFAVVASGRLCAPQH
jgi:hypothetical protein